MRSLRQTPRSFIAANRRVARRIERAMGHPEGYEHHPLQARYVETVAAAANALQHPTIIDLGAGRHCHIAARLPDRGDASIIGIDVEAAAMDANPDLDRRVVLRPGERWPLPADTADLVVSMSTLEHIQDVQLVAHEIARVLKSGGRTIHIFPSRNAPFALLNRFLPEVLKRRLLHALIPGSEGIQGFPAHYHRCTAGDMSAAFSAAGLEVESVEVTYYQSDYYAFFLPSYLLSLAYDLLMARLNRRGLASAVLVVARKPAA